MVGGVRIRGSVRIQQRFDDYNRIGVLLLGQLSEHDTTGDRILEYDFRGHHRQFDVRIDAGERDQNSA